MPAPKFLDISQFGKTKVKRMVEEVVETGLTDLGRKVVTTREVEKEFDEISALFSLDEVKICENELGPLTWFRWHDGRWAAKVFNGIDTRRIILSEEDYEKHQAWLAAKKGKDGK